LDRNLFIESNIPAYGLKKGEMSQRFKNVLVEHIKFCAPNCVAVRNSEPNPPGIILLSRVAWMGVKQNYEVESGLYKLVELQGSI